MLKQLRGIMARNTVIYLVLCKRCKKYYVGRTTTPLSIRTNLHRGCFIRFVKTNGRLVVPTEKLDQFVIGMHLYKQHGILTKQQFDDNLELYILEVCSPRDLDIKEHKWIQKLKALSPYGLNISSPFGFPLLP